MTMPAPLRPDGHTPGPYWLSQTDTEFLVCGAHGKVMFRYAPGQEALAIAHVKRLQKGRADHAGRQAGNGDLTLELLAALKGMLPANLCVTNRNVSDDVVVPLEVTMGDLRKIAAAISRAEPQL
jgi:hypothetical protein